MTHHPRIITALVILIILVIVAFAWRAYAPTSNPASPSSTSDTTSGVDFTGINSGKNPSITNNTQSFVPLDRTLTPPVVATNRTQTNTSDWTTTNLPDARNNDSSNSTLRYSQNSAPKSPSSQSPTPSYTIQTTQTPITGSWGTTIGSGPAVKNPPTNSYATNITTKTLPTNNYAPDPGSYVPDYLARIIQEQNPSYVPPSNTYQNPDGTYTNTASTSSYPTGSTNTTYGGYGPNAGTYGTSTTSATSTPSGTGTTNNNGNSSDSGAGIAGNIVAGITSSLVSSLLSSLASSGGGYLQPFGGKIVFTFYCTCSASALVTIADVSGKQVQVLYMPGVSRLFANFNIYTSGVNVLGTYIPNGMQCYFYAGTTCATFGSPQGIINQVGTSAI